MSALIAFLAVSVPVYAQSAQYAQSLDANKIGCLVNEYRRRNNLNLLQQSVPLQSTSSDFATYLTTQSTLVTADAAGNGAGARADQHGFPWVFVSQTLAEGYTNEVDFVNAMIADTPSNGNLLQAGISKIGVGVANNSTTGNVVVVMQGCMGEGIGPQLDCTAYGDLTAFKLDGTITSGN